ncbi:MAG TPA: flagellar basal-body MS-ring/collar protein FliF [Hydrogenophaga sp.]|uniref:flagellar basal-body MS-ring/collar protein FliF n=1 Tax=Hydrogenophaga sp. TaxID=1904254 RepID=UPI002C15F23C|nr:flagellar basal-body MS-ring/collar protein FliF [Hydrogenophaga sp.]HSX92126.1 flagellar basal-body MS-ring/collar protein FliF [Hydrogenophaga sp.]
MSTTAVAEVNAQPVRANALAEGFARMDNAQKIKLGLGALALLAIALAFFFMGRQPDWRVLYTNLGDKDGGAIVAQLSQMNVPYKHSDGGGAIMVPADKVHDTRLRLASQGLPKGSVTGFELMESNRFGMTQFQERLSFQRGLEGELTRSIQSLASVQSARVHLALPNQNGFFREQQKASASVLLTLHPGRTLDRAQVAGIVHLVASSVPEMNPKAVSVVDDQGSLLSNPPDGQNAPGADVQKLQYAQQLEQLYTRRILDMLEPLVGAGNVKAQVSADIDFSQAEMTSEQHRPNQGNEPSAVRSQQTIEDGNPASAQPAGVPGAVSNQPPAPGNAPINGTAAPVGVAQQGSTDKPGNTRRESVINYEVDRTVRTVRESSGNIRRLSAAVVVNHKTSLDKNGKPVTTPIPPQQIEQMTALVRETIGFNQTRGDSVNLVNAPFNEVVASEPEALPFWQQADNVELARSLAFPLGMLGLGLIVLMGMVRPALKLMKSPAPKQITEVQPLNAVLNEMPERPGLPMPTPDEETPEKRRIADAKRLALENPAAVANIVKGWVNGEPAN